MKLGFVTAIVPELSLDEVISFAADTGYQCIEVMCWPKGKAERRYAGITHIDVAELDEEQAGRIRGSLADAGVEISGLGYYPNPLTPDAEESAAYVEHIKAVMRASKLLDIGVMNTFIGRDWTKSVEDNWPRFLEVWRPLIDYAEELGVRVGIENCPMLFTYDEWPGGKNLAHSPTIWRRMFEDIPNKNFGLNYDPSHLVWQHMDYIRPIYEFADRLMHVHAKDARVDRDKLTDLGVLATPIQWHTPKLPGLGDVAWNKFFSALTDVGYRGPVCVEVEDRAFEGDLDSRKESLRRSQSYLKQFFA